MRPLLAVLFVLAAVAGAASAGFVDPSEEMPGATNAPAIARFAVLVFNLNRGAKLKYVSVSNSDRHSHDGGVRYQMIVTAADTTGATGQYRAVVWGIPKTFQWMLLEFKHIN